MFSRLKKILYTQLFVGKLLARNLLETLSGFYSFYVLFLKIFGRFTTLQERPTIDNIHYMFLLLLQNCLEHVCCHIKAFLTISMGLKRQSHIQLIPYTPYTEQYIPYTLPYTAYIINTIHWTIYVHHTLIFYFPPRKVWMNRIICSYVQTYIILYI